MSDEIPQNTPENPGHEDIKPGNADTDQEAVSESDQSQSLSIFIPYLLLALSFGVYLVAQISETNTRHGQLEQAVRQQEQAVQQANQINSALTRFYTDLTETAKTDNDAKAIVNKYANVLHLNPTTPGEQQQGKK